MTGIYARVMRTALVLAVFVVAAAPAAAVPAKAGLTLNAPGATTFGHVVDFAGRLSPSAPGTRVSLMRGKTVLAAMALKRDGTYRFQVELGRPGPFHTVAAGVSSKPVVVRIVPELRAKLVGSRVVGTPLTLVARLYPDEAGDVRVRVVRDGSYAYRGAFAESARVRLGTASPAPFAVAVDVLPAKGYGYVGERIRVALRAPTVAYGYQGPFVSVLLERLRDLGYAAPSPRTVFDSDAQQAVYAFQKAQRLERTGVADAAFWQRLARPAEIVPRHRFPASHIEIDKARQILMVVRDGRAVLVLARLDRRRLLDAGGAVLDHPQGPRLRPEPARRALQADVLLRRVRDPRQPVGSAVPGIPRLRTRAELRRRSALLDRAVRQAVIVY